MKHLLSKRFWILPLLLLLVCQSTNSQEKDESITFAGSKLGIRESFVAPKENAVPAVHYVYSCAKGYKLFRKLWAGFRDNTHIELDSVDPKYEWDYKNTSLVCVKIGEGE